MVLSRAVCASFFFFHVAVAAYTARVQEMAMRGFALRNFQQVHAYFEQHIPLLSSFTEKKEALSLFAQYLELHDAHERAAHCYRDAALYALGTERVQFLLEATRNAMAADAREYARETLAEVEHIGVQVLNKKQHATFLVYHVWLALHAASTAAHLHEQLERLEEYGTQGVFNVFETVLLFTRWWITQDEKVAQRLTERYPQSFEALSVIGAVEIAPSVFWHLMPRAYGEAVESMGKSETVVLQDAKLRPVPEVVAAHRTRRAHVAADGTAARSAMSSSHNLGVSILEGGVSVPDEVGAGDEKPRGYQLGFFRAKENAQRLMDDLERRGFGFQLNTVRRADAVYYQVFVPEDDSGFVGHRLKDAGYETFPLF